MASSLTRKARIYVCVLVLSGLSAPLLSWLSKRPTHLLRPVLEAAGLIAAVLFCVGFARRRYREQLQDARRHSEEMAGLYLSVIEAMALAIEAKDRSTQRRLRRVQTFAAELGKLMGLGNTDLEALRAGALLHDIGKVAVPEYILCKPGRLTQEEFEKMSIHPRVGAEILERVRFPYPVARVVRSHHEKFDGTGYPDGLKGEQISLPARILAVVDSFDALTSERPYRRPLSRDEAIAQLRKGSGGSFDPEIVRLFLAHLDRLERLAGERDEAAEARTTAGGAAGASESAAADRAPLSPSTARTIASVHQESYGLYEIARGMTHSLDLDESMRHLSETVARLVHHRCLVLFLVDRERRSLRARYVTGRDAVALSRLEIRFGERTTGRAAQQREAAMARPEAAGTPADALRHDFEEMLAAGSVDPTPQALSVPLLDGEQIMGALALYDAAERPYTSADARTLMVIARQLAEAVRNAVLYERTHQSAMTDPLTRLPNARFLFGSFDREMARAEELGVPLSIIELDVNNFKTINDRYGHPAGDRVLRGVARAIRSQLRPNDTCVRYAGDEFIITVPGLGAGGIEAVQSRIEVAIGRHKFAVARSQSIRVSVSMGAASFPEDGRTYEALISVADTRMYHNKFARRGPGADPTLGLRFPGRTDISVN
jgi:diguanylate cyclase (GGDEF)-like protein/putative nucleotidyltransferase with HDIG domain